MPRRFRPFRLSSIAAAIGKGEREGMEGREERGGPCQGRDTIHFKNDFRALSRAPTHSPFYSSFGSSVRDCCAGRGRSSCNREDKNSTEGRNIVFLDTGQPVALCSGTMRGREYVSSRENSRGKLSKDSCTPRLLFRKGKNPY